jgi:hypothetical protein
MKAHAWTFKTTQIVAIGALLAGALAGTGCNDDLGPLKLVDGGGGNTGGVEGSTESSAGGAILGGIAVRGGSSTSYGGMVAGSSTANGGMVAGSHDAGGFADVPVGGSSDAGAIASGGTSGSSSDAGSTSSWGTAGTGGDGSTGSVVPGGFSCPVTPSACNDGVDNDGDGLIDAQDPECVGPCDNDEGTFATGIPGDNIDACKQDCFFDGNSGQGDDGCDWNLKCDPRSPGADAAKACPYDPNFKNCPTTQSDKCIKFCQRITPNGCDCFGCCKVPWNGSTVTIMLAANCSAASYGDPSKCPACTQNDSCTNPCGKCEICLGKPQPDPGCVLPPPGTPVGNPDSGAGGAGGSSGAGGAGGSSGAGGAGGSSGAGGTGGSSGTPPDDLPCGPNTVYCGNGGTCPSGQFCLTGCCTIP